MIDFVSLFLSSNIENFCTEENLVHLEEEHYVLGLSMIF